MKTYFNSQQEGIFTSIRSYLYYNTFKYDDKNDINHSMKQSLKNIEM